jgi:hypothetical protein
MNLRRMAAGLILGLTLITVGCAHNYDPCRQPVVAARPCCPPSTYAAPAINTAPVPVTAGFATVPAVTAVPTVPPNGCCR